jgi:hypothetical protein
MTWCYIILLEAKLTRTLFFWEVVSYFLVWELRMANSKDEIYTCDKTILVEFFGYETLISNNLHSSIFVVILSAFKFYEIALIDTRVMGH